MRIAYIYDAVYPWIKGGVEKRIYELGRRLAEKHEVHWFGVGWWGNKEVELEGIKLHPVCKPVKLYVKGRRSIISAMRFAAGLIKASGDFDVVDCQSFPYFPAITQKLRFSKAKSFLTWHEFWGDYWYVYLGKAGFFGKCVESAITKLTFTHISVSETTRRELEVRGVNAITIPNGIDFELIKSIEPSDNGTDIIFAGRLIKEKNLPTLIEALNKIDATCTIVGNGPERDSIVNLVKKYDLQGRVIFRNFMGYEKLISLMKSSKVFVLPSTREGFGIVAIEANACGLPVVTVRHKKNAAMYLVKDSGFVASPNPSDLAEKILIALEKRKFIKNRCIKNAKGYDWDKITVQLEALYEGKRGDANQE